ncbi:hypothetical protein PR202_ga04578 [Eleusine coracana subsp. coracana]|uniref:Protein kinase domain-containing protein n=1 Tax=Eleusine coracana subsp. coracana TaxID=191504 RepID=A0AAV5BRH7_ELECO|nr:hypothetical protein PR202_ga04578 [Eleusine coracana subsp. coracana]
MRPADADALSPPAPSPVAADDLAPWPATRGDDGGGGGGRAASPLFTILPVSAFGIGVVLLVAVAVVLVVTRRGKPTRTADAGGESCSGDGKPAAPPSSCGSHTTTTTTRCYAAAGKQSTPPKVAALFVHCESVASMKKLTVLVCCSAAAGGVGAGVGCIYGAGRLGLGFAAAQHQHQHQQAARRSRGAQVFTYRELERATDGFSEANVVGRGAYGVVFRGRLNDGTPAAIKRLRLDHRRQGEREFRIEVTNQTTPSEPLYTSTSNSRVVPDPTCTSSVHRFRAPTGARLLALLLPCCRAQTRSRATSTAREDRGTRRCCLRGVRVAGLAGPLLTLPGHFDPSIPHRILFECPRSVCVFHCLLTWSVVWTVDKLRAQRIVDLLSRMDSPFLVGLLGYCADQSHRLLLFEFMPNGSLKGHLHPSPPPPATGDGSHPLPRPPLDWQTRLGIALDCARALEFLHEHTSPAVIHRDFKCSNILLDHNYRARVSDFGMAKVGSNKADGQVVTRVLGTTGYLAPEYASTGKLTTKSDVYSYGVVLLELLTGRVPVDTKRPPGQHVLVSWALPRLTNRQKLVEMVDPALKGQFALKDLVQVAAIAAMCIQTKAEYRPLMTDVVQSLIPIAKTTPAISCSSTPLRPLHHVIYMSPHLANKS